MEKAAPVRLLLALAAALVALAAVADAQQSVGDACRGGAGECRSISDCPEAQEALRRKERPDVCSYQGFTPIVCCSVATPPSAPPSAPPTRPPSAASGNGQASERIASSMCTKYGEAVYRYEKTFHTQRRKVDQCATKGFLFIVKGVEAVPDEFPHMALLGYGQEQQPKWACGGSLISERFVLTAAHCIFTDLGSPKVARLGELNHKVTNDRTQHEDVSVAQAIPHPAYKAGVRYNDIGLLRLARDVAFTSAIRPACLHTRKEIADAEAVATGWGHTKWISPQISDHLMKVKLPIRKTETCSTAFKTLSTTFQLRRGILEESMVCAGGIGGKDTCTGDSGGPLQLKLVTPYCMYSVLGVTSFGPQSCGNTQSPGVYTRVSHFVPWIVSIVWPSQK